MGIEPTLSALEQRERTTQSELAALQTAYQNSRIELGKWQAKVQNQTQICWRLVGSVHQPNLWSDADVTQAAALFKSKLETQRLQNDVLSLQDRLAMWQSTAAGLRK